MSHPDSEGADARATSAGFSLGEVLLVLLITGILVVSLAAVVDVPREMLERELGSQVAVSDLDRALSELDRDVRYALDVHATDPWTLDVTAGGGAHVAYAWDGNAGSPLVRTDAGGTIQLVARVKSAAFAVGTSTVRRLDVGSVPSTTTTGTAARFDGFTLLPGFAFAPPDGALSVVESIGFRTLGPANVVGIYFTANDALCDQAHPLSCSAYLRRNGSSDLLAVLYRADPDTRTPIRTEDYATGLLTSRAIPGSMSRTVFRLTPHKRLTRGQAYFLELHGAGGPAADVETRTLSNAAAVLGWGGGALWSSDGGRSFASLTGTLETSQVRFEFDVTREQSAGPADVFANLDVEVPTSVGVEIVVDVGDGAARTVRSSFPLENNLALVNR